MAVNALPILVDDDGKALPTMAAARKYLQRYVERQEAADFMQALELAGRHARRVAPRPGRGRLGRRRAATAAIEYVIPLRAAERLFAEASRGKAAGFDGIPDDAFSLLARKRRVSSIPSS